MIKSLSFDTSGEEPESFAARLDAALPPSARMNVARGARGVLSGATLGPGAVLADLQVDAQHLQMGPRRRGGSLRSLDERFSVALRTAGTCRVAGRGVEESRPGLVLLDLTSDFSISYSGAGRSISFDSRVDFVGTSIDAVRSAIGRTRESPLHDLVARHLLDLADSVQLLSPATLATAGRATAGLVQALVDSLSLHPQTRTNALADSLPARIEEYVRHHLNEPDLTPERIAHALHISVRYLYVLLADKPEPPAEWIVQQRLAAAKSELDNGAVGIGSIAQRWGFKSHAHFTRRFKREYGVAPRDYAHQSGNNPQGGASALRSR